MISIDSGVSSWETWSSPTRLESVWTAADVNFDAVGATTVPEVREDQAAQVPEVSTVAPAIWKTSKKTATISATPIRCEMKLRTIRFSTKVSHEKKKKNFQNARPRTSFRGPPQSIVYR